VVFFISTYFIKPKENQNLAYIPAEADFVCKIDGNKFIEDVLYELLLESKDNQSLQELRTFWNEELKSKNQFKDRGIDLNSEIVIYGKSVHDGMLIYTLFNLTDSEKFKAHIEKDLSYFQALQCTKKVGVIVSYVGASDYMNTQELANEALKEKREIPKGKNEASMLRFSSRNIKVGDYRIQTKGGITATISKSDIRLDGKFVFTSEKKPYINAWSLKKEHLSMHAVLLEKKQKDSLASVFRPIGFQFPAIEEISLNYENMTLQEAESGLVLSPNADLLLHFSEDFDLASVFADTEKLGVMGYRYANGQLQMGSSILTVDSLDKRTLFIGKNPRNILSKPTDNLFSVSGDLLNLTNIEGGGFIIAMISMYPPFKSSRGFFQAIQHTDIQIKEEKNKVYSVNGNILFKEKRQPVLETMKLFIGLQ
jgi:hypothetical protein